MNDLLIVDVRISPADYGDDADGYVFLDAKANRLENIFLTLSSIWSKALGFRP